MKTLVVYDSMYGNTEQIARSIGAAIAGDVKVARPGEVNQPDMEGLSLLIVGSPTHGGRPSPAVQEFLNKLSEFDVKGIGITAFDTRFTSKWVKIFGYPAGRMVRTLEKLGGVSVASPEGFFVEGTKGPIKEGELERAKDWAKSISESLQ